MQKILSYFISAVAAMASTGCASQYDINGDSNLSMVDGNMVYLRVNNNGMVYESSSIDSCMVEHGRFHFVGSADSVVLAQVCLDNGFSFPLVLEEAPIRVRIDAVGQTVEGGPLNKQLYKFLQKRDRLENQILRAEQEFMQALRQGDTDLKKMRERLDKQSGKLLEEIEDAETKFVKDNYGNALGPGYFMMICNQHSHPVLTEQLLDIAENAPAEFISHPCVANYLMAAGYHFKSKKNKKRIK